MRQPGQRGLTLIEMVIVVTIISVMIGVTAPLIGSGLDALRLEQSAETLAAFLNSGWNRAERRQVPVEVTVSPPDNAVYLESPEPGFTRKYEPAGGIRITAILPKLPGDEEAARRYLLMPGGTFPRFVVELGTGRGGRRRVSLDPITGVPQITQPPEREQEP